MGVKSLSNFTTKFKKITGQVGKEACIYIWILGKTIFITGTNWKPSINNYP